jgi:NADH dehydrogenase
MKSRDGKLEVVIIGGGYGGLEVIRTLKKNREFRRCSRMTLIDKENYFLFTPLLADIASGSVEPRHIVYPLRSFTSRHGIRFIKNKLRRLDPETRRVHLYGGLTTSYDSLVLGLGSQVNFYGVPGAEKYSFTLKSTMDAIRIRAQVVEMFELADQAENPRIRRRLLTFVVVGGGLTGVEIASEMMLFIRNSLLPRFPGLSANELTVHLIEGADRLIPQVRPEHGRVAEKHLRGLGVNLLFNRNAVAVQPDRVDLDDGSSVPAHTVIWTAGIRGSAPEDGWPEGFPLTRDGKIEVDSGGRVTGYPGVYALGDLAQFPDVRQDRPVPAVAQGAIQGGRVVAANLLADMKLGEATEMRFVDFGYIVGLGKRSSVAHFMGWTVPNWLGWYVWALVYLVKMVGFRKQLEVAIDHIKGFLFDRDISQIHDRKAVLREGDFEVRLVEDERDIPDPPSGAG